jgi:transketolase
MVECYETALILKDNISVMACSRQALPVVRTTADENLSARGGYVLYEPKQPRQLTLIATGSEVSLALKASEMLSEHGVSVAVVSMPCTELFDQQSQEYRNAVLGNTPCVIVEAGSSFGWARYLGKKGGDIVGVDTFGESGKGDEVLAHFGFTPEHVVDVCQSVLKQS